MDKLLPCPFCGGEADCSKDGISDMDGKPMWWVECPTCGISTSGNYERQPEVDAWNRRADHLPDATKMVSNADRIRSMSDEELATEITKNPSIPCRMCEYYNHKLGHCDTQRDFVCVTAYAEALALEWLKQPVKEE